MSKSTAGSPRDATRQGASMATVASNTPEHPLIPRAQLKRTREEEDDEDDPTNDEN